MHRESFQLADPRLIQPPVPTALADALPPLYDGFHSLGCELLALCGEHLLLPARPATEAQEATVAAAARSLFVAGHERARKHRSVLRVTRYPALRTLFADSAAMAAAQRESELTRISPHRDLGTLTLLAQDDQGGLEVRSRTRLPVCAGI